MKERGYPTWDRVFIENLIRAIQARLTGKVFGEQYSHMVLNREAKKGFELVPFLYDVIGHYEKNRYQYQNFRAFFPEIFIHLSKLPKEKNKILNGYIDLNEEYQALLKEKTSRVKNSAMRL